MSPAEKRNIEKDSDYPELAIPVFEAKIPDHLLKDVPEDMKYIIQQSSLQSQSLEWLCRAMQDTNQQVRKTNGRLKVVEEWKEKVSSSWTLLVGILFVAGSALTWAYYIFRMITGI